MKADPKAESAKPGNSKLLLLIGVAVLVLGGGAGAALYFMQSKAEPGAHKETKPAAAPVYVTIEPFTINLVPENGDQYLQMQFTLQVPNEHQVEIIKSNMPKVRSRVLMLLSAKKASDLNSVDGKRQLSNEIIAAVKQPFADKADPQQVSDVLYTSFIIQ